MTFPPKHLKWPSAPPLPPQRPGMPERLIKSVAASAQNLSCRIRSRDKPPPVPPKLRISAPMPVGTRPSGTAKPGAAAVHIIGKGQEAMPSPLLQSVALGKQRDLYHGSTDSLARRRAATADRTRLVRWSSADNNKAAASTAAPAARPQMAPRSNSLGGSYSSIPRARRRRALSSAAIRATAAAATAVRPRPGGRSTTSDGGGKTLIDLSGSGWYCADPARDVHAEHVREAAEQARAARHARREREREREEASRLERREEAARLLASLAATTTAATAVTPPAPSAFELPEEDRLHILARGPQSTADAETREDWWAE